MGWKPYFAAGALMLLLGSCGGQRAITADNYILYVHRTSLIPRGGMDAEIRGLLAIHGPCVVLESEDGGLWYPVVWPGGTSIGSTDPLVLRLPSGDSLALGEAISGGGGYLKAADVQVDIPEACLPDTREVAVLNPDEPVTKG